MKQNFAHWYWKDSLQYNKTSLFTRKIRTINIADLMRTSQWLLSLVLGNRAGRPTPCWVFLSHDTWVHQICVFSPVFISRRYYCGVISIENHFKHSHNSGRTKHRRQLKVALLRYKPFSTTMAANFFTLLC